MNPLKLEISKYNIKTGGEDLFSRKPLEDVPGFVFSSESISVGWCRESWDELYVIGLK